MNDIYDESVEDASAIVALLGAGADEADLLDAWSEWATTEDDADVVERLYQVVSPDFRDLIIQQVDIWADELTEDGWDDDENGWLELFEKLTGLEEASAIVEWLDAGADEAETSGLVRSVDSEVFALVSDNVGGGVDYPVTIVALMESRADESELFNAIVDWLNATDYAIPVEDAQVFLRVFQEASSPYRPLVTSTVKMCMELSRLTCDEDEVNAWVELHRKLKSFTD